MSERHIGSVSMALCLLLSGCGSGGTNGDANANAPPSPAPPTQIPPPPDCAVNGIRTSEDSIIASCMSVAAKEAIRREYTRRIDNGTILQFNAGFDPRLYPGEVIYSVLALGRELSDQKLVDWSFREIDAITRRLAENNGFWLEPFRADWPDQTEPTFGQLSQSRLLLSLVMIYDRTGYQPARDAALLAYAGLQRMPRGLVTSRLTGRQYMLTYYAYQNTSQPVIVSGRDISPNHDAAIAASYLAAATYLLQSPGEVAAALEQFNIFKAAALDLATPDRCLPLDGDPTYAGFCDTRYNGYWASSLALIDRIRPDSEARAAISAQTPYLQPSLSSFQTRRYYPTMFEGNYPDPVEPVLFWSSLARLLANSDAIRLYIQRTNLLIETQDPAQWPSGNLYPAYYF